MKAKRIALLTLLASAIFHCLAAQPAAAANVGAFPNDQFGFVTTANVRGFLLTASPGVTDPFYIISGLGEVVGYGTSKLYINPDQPQWRLNTQGVYTEVLNTHPPVQAAHARVALQGFNPEDVDLTGEQISFNGLAAASTLIRDFTVGHSATGVPPVSLDITDFVRSRPVQTDIGGSFIDLGFSFRFVDTIDNASYVLFSGFLNVESRDGSSAEPFLPAVTTITPGLGGQTTITSSFSVTVPPMVGNVYDPDLASSYLYQTTNGSLFTRIDQFPSGFDNPFTVSIDDVVLGQFSPGDFIDLTTYPGGGVSSFRISGISPSVDPTNQLAFPLGLAFNQAEVAFDMIAVVPEPSSLALAVAAFVGLAGWSRRRTRSIASVKEPNASHGNSRNSF